MPTYDYLCQTCSHRFETWQKMTDEPLTTCPECGSELRRILYPAGIVFKGSGFYVNDHGSKSGVASDTSANGKKAEGTDGNAASSKGEGKISSEGSTRTGVSPVPTNSANSSKSSNSSESKAKTPAPTK